MFNFQFRSGSEMSKVHFNKFNFPADEQCFYLESSCLSADNDKPLVGCDDVELGFMASETVMTPIP